MATWKVFYLLTVFAAMIAGVIRGYNEDEFKENLEAELSSIRERRFKAFECNNLSESCRGVVPCCGSLQCYWKDGYSLTKAGVCVQCVSNGQLCQRDTQCCSSLVCQKDNAYYVDGSCAAPRPSGGECHENDQCASGNCVISTWKKLKGYGGKCA